MISMFSIGTLLAKDYRAGCWWDQVSAAAIPTMTNSRAARGSGGREVSQVPSFPLYNPSNGVSNFTHSPASPISHNHTPIS